MLDTMKSTVLSKGPNGEAAVSAESVSLTPEEIAKVKAMHATAAISLQYTSTEWARAQIKGIPEQLAEYGIPVIAVTDAGFKAETQVSQIETLLARKPSIIISIPVGPDATADVFHQGVKRVFMDNIPKGFVAGKDYVSDVWAGNYGNGVVSGLLMAKALGGKGTVGLIYHAADVFVTRQRYDGFKGTIAAVLIWMVVFGIVGHVVLRRTTFGRRVLATGGNETFARYSGVDTASIKFRVLMLSSVAAAGMLYAGRLHSGRFQFGEGDVLSVIAAAVLGGTSLFGGAGTVVGSIRGAMMIGLIIIAVAISQTKTR